MKAGSPRKSLLTPKRRASFVICKGVGFIEVESLGGRAGGGDLGICLWLFCTAVLRATETAWGWGLCQALLCPGWGGGLHPPVDV